MGPSCNGAACGCENSIENFVLGVQTTCCCWLGYKTGAQPGCKKVVAHKPDCVCALCV